jgi:hypothetical protein
VCVGMAPPTNAPRSHTLSFLSSTFYPPIAQISTFLSHLEEKMQIQKKSYTFQIVGCTKPV